MDKDQKRINGIARGDRNALIELIADWKGPIHSYFYRSLSNYADAEDLTQQFFIAFTKLLVLTDQFPKFRSLI